LPQSFSTFVWNQEPQNSNLGNESAGYDAGISSGTNAHRVGGSNRGLINLSAGMEKIPASVTLSRGSSLHLFLHYEVAF